MKLLSDFDGVFTNQDDEAAEVGARLGEVIDDTELLRSLREEVRARPERHGWFVGARVSCYADEDPYVFNNAVARALFEMGPRAAVERIVASGYASAGALAQRCFEEGTARYRQRNNSHVDPRSLEAAESWLRAGNELVIVSNSSTDRIESILRGAGLEPGAGGLRIRGDARKFLLGDEPAHLPDAADFGGRAVSARRPAYLDILRSEAPGAVIGDVLSLDVALPVLLRSAEPGFSKLRCVLKRHPHTPAWALAACAQRGIDVVDSLAAFVATRRQD
jgi:hypothetical protein